MRFLRERGTLLSAREILGEDAVHDVAGDGVELGGQLCRQGWTLDVAERLAESDPHSGFADLSIVLELIAAR